MSRWICLLWLLASVGCGAGSEGTLHPAADAISKDASSATEDAAAGRKLIYRGNLSVVVKDFAEAERDLMRILKEAGGLVAQSRAEQRPDQLRSGFWILRVKTEQFDRAVEAICNLGIAERRELTTDDVTAAWVDHTARLVSWQRMEKRLLNLIETNAGDLKDLLTVEGELNRVRSEIEKLEARQRALGDQVTLATITVALREDKYFLPPPQPTFGAKVAAAFYQSCRLLQQTGEELVVFLVAVAPWLIVSLLLMLPFLVWSRRWWRKQPR